MGVLNVTDDSFSDGGLYLNADRAVEHGLALAADGAAIVAVTAWALADSTQSFAPHLDHKAQNEVLKKDGLDEFLRFNGFWK